MRKRVLALVACSLMCCTKSQGPVESGSTELNSIDCPVCDDCSSQIKAAQDLYDLRSRQVEDCEESKSSLKSEVESLEAQIETLNNEAEEWKKLYMNIPTCASKEHDSD